MQQHPSFPCPCGQRHAAGQQGCSRPRPELRKITSFHVQRATASDPLPEKEESIGADYSWQIGGMDCPGCARKIENAVGQLQGVTQARVLFATEKLVVSADKDVQQQVEQAVARAGFTLRSATQPAAKSAGFWRENGMLLLLGGLLLASWLLQTIDPQAGKVAFIVTTLAGCSRLLSLSLSIISPSQSRQSRPPGCPFTENISPPSFLGMRCRVSGCIQPT